MPPHGPTHTGTHTSETLGPGPDGELDLLTQAKVLQRKADKWDLHLSPAEKIVLDQIIRLTVLYRHVTNTRRLCTQQLCDRANYSVRQVRRVLASLRDRGLITTDRADGHGLNVTVDINWEPPAMVPVSKKRALLLVEADEEGCQGRHVRGDTLGTLYKGTL